LQYLPCHPLRHRLFHFAAKYDGAFKIFDVSGTDGPFKMTTSSSTESQPSTSSHQAVDRHWDRLPVPGEDFLKRKSTKTKLGSAAPPSDIFSATEHVGVLTLLAVLGTDSLSWGRPFEAHPHLNQSSARS